MIKEILFVHHSHTDIGYTHPQPVVLELHNRFIDEALDIAEATADWPDDCRFRWTCEVTGITVDWWNQASTRDRDRFLAAVKRGQIEVAGMAWHMTPLMDHGMVVDILKPLKFFRDLGIPVRSAMNTDVNGLPWGVVDSLLDHGITGISMAINEHFGHALRPWPRAFRWQAPSGRTITAYNGFIYGVTSDRNMRVPVDMDEARVRVPQWTKMWEGRGYPHSFLMMQITNVRYHDNGSPQAALPDFIRRWNEENHEVRLRFGTPSEFFDRMRAEPEDLLPLMRGDWTDWWNFGSGSTAHETAQALKGQRDLDDAVGLGAWHTDTRRPLSGASQRRPAQPRALCRAYLGRRPLHQPAAVARDAHPAAPQAAIRGERRQRRAHVAPRRAGADGDRRRGRGTAPAGLQPASLPGEAGAQAALPAAARWRAQPGARLRAGRNRADRPAVAPHPAAGRDPRRYVRRTVVLDQTDRGSGPVVRHHGGGGRDSRRVPADRQRRRSFQRQDHRHPRRKGRRPRLAEARRRRVRRRAGVGRRAPGRSGARTDRHRRPRFHVRPQGRRTG